MIKIRMIISLLLVVGLGCQQHAEEQVKKEIITNYVSGYNDFDVDRMVRDMDHRIISQQNSNGQMSPKAKGIKQFKLIEEENKLYFSTRTQKIKSWDFNDDTVKIEISYFGILKTDLSDKMKSGDTINMEGSSQFIFKDGKIMQIIDESKVSQ